LAQELLYLWTEECFTEKSSIVFKLFHTVHTFSMRTKMPNKEMLSQTIPIIHETLTHLPGGNTNTRGTGVLKKFLTWLKGEHGTTTSAVDPAEAIIARIENEEVAGIVSDLHYKTPRSLLAMRKSCQECFMLPDDCPYYDYSIFDVKKAIKILAPHPGQSQIQAVKELQKVNTELASHLKDYLE